MARIDEKGHLLLEVLVATAVLALVVSFGSQLFLSSARGTKLSQQKDTADGLLTELLEVVKAVSAENWLYTYQPPDGTGNASTTKGLSNHFHPVLSGTKWTFAPGDETVVVNGNAYTRYFYLENVSRDPITRSIESTYISADDDPSTQRITVGVSWPNADAVIMSEYITRWRNKVCAQTNWNGGVSTTVANCASNVYGSVDSNIDLSTSGTIQLKAQ